MNKRQIENSRFSLSEKNNNFMYDINELKNS